MKDVAHLIFGILGVILSLFLFMAPLITFKRIINKRSTEQFSGIPYVVTLLHCLLSTWYGLPFVSPNNLLFSTINGIGVAFCSIYVLAFLIFAMKKEKVKILALLTLELGVFAAVVLTSLFALHGYRRKLFCGLISTIFSIITFASPLTIIKLVIKTKSVEFMPFFISLFMFLCSTSWFAFGLIGRDPFVAIRNRFGCGLGILQLILHAIYQKNKGTPKKVLPNEGSIEVVVADQDKQTSNQQPKPNDQV